MTPSLKLAPVCAILVTYNPSPSLLDNVAALCDEVSRIFLIDNGSSDASLQCLKRLQCIPQCSITFNGDNRGIAAALNQGIRLAEQHGFEWAMTFDQDSTVMPGFTNLMMECCRSASNPARVGIVAPTYIDPSTGAKLPMWCTPAGEVRTAMTSGSLMPLALFAEVGYFDERLYIDYVDIEFCLRIHRAGWSIVQSSKAVLSHALGKLSHHHFLGRVFSTTNHTPERRYYITRNRLYVLRLYRGDLRWALAEIRATVAETAKIALVEQERWKKFRFLARGVADAITGRMGKQVEL